VRRLIWKETQRKVYVAVSSPECKANHKIKIAYSSFVNVAHFRYMGMTATN
jgi:hypothetical protein